MSVPLESSLDVFFWLHSLTFQLCVPWLHFYPTLVKAIVSWICLSPSQLPTLTILLFLPGVTFSSMTSLFFLISAFHLVESFVLLLWHAAPLTFYVNWVIVLFSLLENVKQCLTFFLHFCRPQTRDICWLIEMGSQTCFRVSSRLTLLGLRERKKAMECRLPVQKKINKNNNVTVLIVIIHKCLLCCQTLAKWSLSLSLSLQILTT